jgi:hypothetical protein
MWPVANLAFGMAAPEKTIHYRGGFPEDGEAKVFRKQEERGSGSGLAKQCAQEVSGNRNASHPDNFSLDRDLHFDRTITDGPPTLGSTLWIAVCRDR